MTKSENPTFGETFNYDLNGNIGDVASYRGNQWSSSQYDANGNLTKDVQTGSEYEYNLLNLPIGIKTSQGETYNWYMMDGTKYSTMIDDNHGIGYLGSLVFNGFTLDYAKFGEGQIMGNGEVRYFVKDHVGSVRAVVGAEGGGISRTDYTSFGGNRGGEIGRYGFGGKERMLYSHPELLDFEARYLRNSRFNSQDPLSEKYYSISPYAYCANNPLRFIDPNGEEFDDYRLKQQTGEIFKFKDTDDNFDQLFAYNDQTGKDDKLRVNDQNILPKLSGKPNFKQNTSQFVWGKEKDPVTGKIYNVPQYIQVDAWGATTTNGWDAKRLFVFAGSHSKAEWDLPGFNSGFYFIGTTRENASTLSAKSIEAAFGEKYSESRTIYNAHSHGGTVPGVDFVPSDKDRIAASKYPSRAQVWLFMPKNPNGQWRRLK